jgi:hypothetical protein
MPTKLSILDMSLQHFDIIPVTLLKNLGNPIGRF